MIKNIKRRYFEIWGDEEAQNVFLKGALFVISALFIAQSTALIVISLRKPILVAVGQKESKVFSMETPPEELLIQELRRQVRRYVETHYNWDAATIERAHEEAARYVSEKFVKAFRNANAEQVRMAKEKHVSQKVYVSGEITIDAKAMTARVPLDRILVLEGLRASMPLTLDVSFESGPRTEKNPEGVYITSERVTSN